MTISLAAVFIPLVFMSGLVGRIFREFAITIVVAIFASGLVSLTLTPLMCARLLKDRGPGAKKTWMERVIGAVEKRVLAVYGASLWWFLRRRWISVLIWVVCLAGTVWLFMAIPKTFLPAGDSSFIWGVMIAREGSSPEQMRALQDQADEAIRQNPAVEATFTMTGNGSFFRPTRDCCSRFSSRPTSVRLSRSVAGQLMGQLGAIPGMFPFLRPFPVLEISTGATSRNQGQYAFSVSGVNPDQVYEVAERLMGKLREYQGFQTISSDYFHNTPNLDIDIRRDQAKMYGVSETRILTLLRNAYSQNYLYLIKKPEDQYQVILEVADADRSKPQDLSLLYIKSDDGKNLVPLNALVKWKTTLGPQCVNHLNQFPSVTFFFNLKPGVAMGDATDFITKAAAEIVPSTMRAALQGEALTFQNTVRDLTILMALAVFVMYVILAILYESYVHPLTVLSTLPTALVGGLLTLFLFGEQASLYAFVGLFMLMGIVKKNGIMIVDFARQRRRCRRIRGTGHPRCEHGPVPAHYHDDACSGHRRYPHRGGLRGRRSFSSAARAGRRRRPGGVPVHHALHHAGHLLVSRGVPGEGAGSFVLLPLGTLAHPLGRGRCGCTRQYNSDTERNGIIPEGELGGRTGTRSR